MTSQLTHLWRIRFQNGFEIECYRVRKPTRLADSWAKEETASGPYGTYTIEDHGLFNRKIRDVRPLSDRGKVNE